MGRHYRCGFLLIALLLAGGCGRGARSTGAASPSSVPVAAGVPASPGLSPSASPAGPSLALPPLPPTVGPLRDAVARHPSDAAARLALGRALLDAQRDDEARSNLEQAVALQPDNVEAWKLLHRLASNAGDLARAHEIDVRLARLAPQDPEIIESLAWSYGYEMPEKATSPDEKVRDYRMAIAQYQKLYDLRQKAHAHVDMIVYRLSDLDMKVYQATHDAGSRTQAVERIQQYLKADPNTPLAPRMRELVGRPSGKTEE